MKPTLDTFLKDVAKHHIEIIRDDGLYRHVRFRRPGTYCMGFDLITWPGYLCYCGDMGTYTFTRIPDMFGFFRGNNINPSYWAEKCVSVDRDGIKEFDEELFRRAVSSYVDDADASDDARAEVEEQIFSKIDDGEYAAMNAVMEFEHHGFGFTDFCEVNIRSFTGRFLWCCYAVMWGVQQYDESLDRLK